MGMMKWCRRPTKHTFEQLRYISPPTVFATKIHLLIIANDSSTLKLDTLAIGTRLRTEVESDQPHSRVSHITVYSWSLALILVRCDGFDKFGSGFLRLTNWKPMTPIVHLSISYRRVPTHWIAA
jgi:hypothetical protein